MLRSGDDILQAGRKLPSREDRGQVTAFCVRAGDALLQTAWIADRVGVRALLIHAEDDAARAFYQHLTDAFEPSPTDPLHLILLMKDLRRAITTAARPAPAG